MAEAFWRRAVAKTASYTLTFPFDKSGTGFTNRGAGGSVTFTLPKPGPGVHGRWYEFRVHADQTLIVAANTNGDICTTGNASANNVSFAIANKKIGRGIMAFCDGTQWLCYPIGNADGFCVNGSEIGASASVLTTPVIDGVTYSALNDRQIIVEVVPFTGTALHAANLPLWVAPANAIILRVILDITTQSSGASTIDIGYTAVSGTTSSDTLLDGVSGASVAQFDSMNAALDSGANAKAQNAASGKWITADEASGDTTAMVANLYVFYILL
jgi:hypothetical protein